MSRKLNEAIRALKDVPQFAIPLLLLALLWVVAGDERLRDAVSRFVLYAYLVEILIVSIAVFVGIVILAYRNRG